MTRAAKCQYENYFYRTDIGSGEIFKISAKPKFISHNSSKIYTSLRQIYPTMRSLRTMQAMNRHVMSGTERAPRNNHSFV